MGVGSGSGNSISFSTIRDFYGDTNPVSLSEFNRSSNNSGLVDSTFSGASTATTNNVSATKNDFGITVANDSTSQTISTGINTFTIDTGTAGGSTVTITVVNNNTDEGSAFLTRGGNTLISTSGAAVTTTVNNGDVLTLSGTGNANPICSYPRLTRVYDVTFANNNSTGDTYTLASSSTGHSTKSVYAAGESQQVKNNSGSNQWTIAYDNVTGAGPGTAGDINVTETSAFTGGLQTQSNSASVSIQSDTAKVEIINSHPDAGGGSSSRTVTVFRNGSSIGTFTTVDSTGNGTSIIACTIAGPANNGAVSSPNGGTHSSGTITFSGGSSSMREVTRAAQFTTVFTNSSGSKSYTLGGSSTGGAATLAAGATRNAQTTNSSGSSWAVHFDTSSGDCNVGIPSTIGAGNPVNMDLFNTVTTPLG